MMECLKCFGNYYILLHTITYASTIVLPGASYQLLPGCGRELLLSQLNQAFWTFHRSRCQDREIIGCKNKEKGAVFNIKSTGGATSFDAINILQHCSLPEQQDVSAVNTMSHASSSTLRHGFREISQIFWCKLEVSEMFAIFNKICWGLKPFYLPAETKEVISSVLYTSWECIQSHFAVRWITVSHGSTDMYVLILEIEIPRNAMTMVKMVMLLRTWNLDHATS